MNGSQSLETNQPILSWIKSLPKVDLHLHLEGAIPAETVWDLAKRKHQTLPVNSIRELSRFCVCDDFERLREVYDLVISCLRTKEDYAASVIAVGKRLREDNVVYAEITCTPYLHVKGGGKFENLLEGLKLGQRQLEKEGGPRIAWIFDFPRHIPESGAATLAYATAAKEIGVIGFGMGGREKGYPASLYADLFDAARSEGLHSVPHAGETVGPDSVREAIELLGAERIGHGVTSIFDPALIEILIARRIPLEICLSSNVCLGVVDSVAQHPIRELWSKGVVCTINTDDPTLFETSLSQEYKALVTELGFTPDDVLALLKNGSMAALPEHRHWVLSRIVGGRRD